MSRQVSSLFSFMFSCCCYFTYSNPQTGVIFKQLEWGRVVNFSDTFPSFPQQLKAKVSQGVQGTQSEGTITGDRIMEDMLLHTDMICLMKPKHFLQITSMIKDTDDSNKQKEW